MSKFFIIYPGGVKHKLSVLELNDSMYYERHEYAMASRKEFDDEEEATDYARNLAHLHDKEFVDDSDGNAYLD